MHVSFSVVHGAFVQTVRGVELSRIARFVFKVACDVAVLLQHVVDCAASLFCIGQWRCSFDLLHCVPLDGSLRNGFVNASLRRLKIFLNNAIARHVYHSTRVSFVLGRTRERLRCDSALRVSSRARQRMRHHGPQRVVRRFR